MSPTRIMDMSGTSAQMMGLWAGCACSAARGRDAAQARTRTPRRKRIRRFIWQAGETAEGRLRLSGCLSIVLSAEPIIESQGVGRGGRAARFTKDAAQVCRHLAQAQYGRQALTACGRLSVYSANAKSAGRP